MNPFTSSEFLDGEMMLVRSNTKREFYYMQLNKIEKGASNAAKINYHGDDNFITARSYVSTFKSFADRDFTTRVVNGDLWVCRTR